MALERRPAAVIGRPVGRVNAEHWSSHLIEFGMVDTPVFAPLRREADSGVARRAVSR